MGTTMKLHLSYIALYILLTFKEVTSSTRPNIIVFICDDMGYNDVGFHGSNQIPTPNIDALAYNGIILNKFYTQPTCTPSRAAFFTGNYPIRTGLQAQPIRSGEDINLPLDIPTMPELLKELGYKTHLVGKWHLGFSRRQNTPTRRGFDTHFGYWGGYVSYFGYNSTYKSTDIEGLDLHDQLDYVWSTNGQYATDVFTDKTLEIIDKYDGKDPLFLVVGHLAPHTGRRNSEMEVPNVDQANSKYRYIQDCHRRLYADTLNRLDQSFGKVVKKLEEKNMLQNSVVLFFSDNGGLTAGYKQNWASNWPLRGVKYSNFEGGVKGTGIIYSPLFRNGSYINNELIHLTDFLPTFYELAGGNLSDLHNIDGTSQLRTIALNEKSNRSIILVDIDEIQNTSAIIGNRGKYKLVTGTYTHGPNHDRDDSYFGESGRGLEVPPYELMTVLESETNVVLSKLTNAPITAKKIEETRTLLDLSECKRQDPDVLQCVEPFCLFDLEKDPCESTNLILEKPKIADRLLKKVKKFYDVLVPQPTRVVDPASNPLYYNNTWCTWLDREWCPS